MSEVPEPCHLCAGACCESFAVNLPPNPQPDVVRWLGLRGKVRGGGLVLEVPCRELTDEGLCGIHDTRPQPCRDYKIGSVECVRAVNLRRSATSEAILASIEAWEASRSHPKHGSSGEASLPGD